MSVEQTRLISVSDDELSDLKRRIRATRWAPEWPLEGSVAGTDPRVLRRLAEYWADGFDWAAQQRVIEGLPSYSAMIDGAPVAFLRFEAEAEAAGAGAGARGLPIILTNGWPSSMLEMVELARRLAAPSRYGLAGATPRTVIVPALPGLPFSPQRRQLGAPTHELWHRLMHDVLGFERYTAHGGDLGAGITSRLAQAHPDEERDEDEHGAAGLALGHGVEVVEAGLAGGRRHRHFGTAGRAGLHLHQSPRGGPPSQARSVVSRHRHCRFQTGQVVSVAHHAAAASEDTPPSTVHHVSVRRPRAISTPPSMTNPTMPARRDKADPRTPDYPV